MNNKPTKSNILLFLSQEKTQFERDFRIAKIGLFGSYARGEETEDSDIDIIVEFFPNTENLTDIKDALRVRIQDTFNRKVDICREKYIKPYFKEQILKSAIYV